MKSKAPLRKPRVEPQSTDAQTNFSGGEQGSEQETSGQTLLEQQKELREAILDDLEVDDWEAETKSLPEWRREELFVGEQDEILAENDVSNSADGDDIDRDDIDRNDAADRITREYEGEEALREAILDDLAGDDELAGDEWEAETKPFARLPREEDDGGSISPEELGEQYLRGAAQQERRAKLDDTEPRINVDVLQDSVEQASLFDRNHDPGASEILPLVDTDETAADAAHRIHHAAAPELRDTGDADEISEDSVPAGSERRVSRSKNARREQATVAPPSHQRRAANAHTQSESGGEKKRKVAR